MQDGDALREVFIEEFGKLQLDVDGKANEEQIMHLISLQLKDQMDEWRDKMEKQADMVEEINMSASGQYARNMIQRIIQGIKDRNI